MSKSENRNTGRPQGVQDPIAIIGMGCLFPKADNLGAYWANIKNRVDAIIDIPDTHWNVEDYYCEDPKKPDHTYGKRGGYLSEIEFNPIDFGIPPNTVEAIDTSQLLGLVAARRAMSDAGYGPGQEFDRSRVSVLIGVTGALELTATLGARLGHPKWRKALKDAGVDNEVAEDVIERILEQYVPWQENSFPGLLGNVVSGRICKNLDLGGTNCAVDAACASSFSAIHLAQLELAAGRSDMVITGGVDTFNDIFMYICFSKTPALSPTGETRPFDAQADGMMLGEGLGIVVLKRLADAERDNDRIYALIRSMGTSSDGSGDAIYAPSAKGQMNALRRAYEQADVSPNTIELVEAHGTGTKVGDMVELSALAEVYGEAGGGQWCALGSVKSQIGHAKAAAGAAGLIKGAMALHCKTLPPTINVTKPNDAIAGGKTPFYVNIEKRPWLPNEEHPRRAGISAFGFGGSNYHCLLEEHGAQKAAPDWEGDVEIFAFSADTTGDLSKAILRMDTKAKWAELGIAARESRKDFDAGKKCRLLFVVHKDDTDLDKLVANAHDLLDGKADARSWESPAGVYFSSGDKKGKLAFVFPGQGAQYVGMQRDLACLFPEFLDTLALANDAIKDKRLSDFIYPHPAFDKDAKAEQDAALRATQVAQPAIGAACVGTLKALKTFSVEPEAVAGHSYGELVALYASGRISEKDLYAISRLRGTLMAAGGKDKGSMLAVCASIKDVERVIKENSLNLVLANKNAPNQAVLSGDTSEIERAKKVLTENKIKSVILPVAAAFHSKFVSDASVPFLKALEKVEFAKSDIPVFANTTATEYPAAAKAARELLANQLAKPVEFVAEIENMYESGVRTFLEVGPGARLTSLVKSVLADKDADAFSADESAGKRSGSLDLARALARLAALGHRVDFSKWNEGCYEEQPASGSKKPKLTMMISGANYVSPRTPKPPVEKPHAAPKLPAPQAMNESLAIPEDLATALRSTQDNLAALQKLQAHTAKLHQQFLEGQEAAANTLNTLLTQQQGLLGSGELTPTIFSPPVQPTPEPVSVVPEPEPVEEPKTEEPPAAEQAAGGEVEAVLLETIADKTGYPVEMLELDMSLDADLGIDSIKRVEILSALQEKLPDAPEIGAEQLGTIQTLRQIVEFLAVEGVTQSSEPSSGAGQAETERVLLETISEKTGYPSEMLDLDMSLDADLGIDSIKRVEILSALQEKLPDAPEIGAEQLGTIQTLRQIVEFLAVETSTEVPAPSTGTGQAETEKALLETISEKTGYPVEMLELDMSLDSDLGIDSIKRVEILSALQEKIPDAPEIGPEQLGSIQTLRQIVEYLSENAEVVEQPADAKSVPPSIKVQVESKINTMAVRCAPLNGVASGEAISLATDSPIWIACGDSRLGECLKQQLDERGCDAKIVSLDKLNDLDAPSTLAGLIVVSPEGNADHEFLFSAFGALQKAAAGLRKAKGVFATVSRMDGKFGLAGGRNPISGGLAGMSKTASHEWPEVLCKAIDLADDYNSPEDAAKAIANEVILPSPTEVGLSKDGSLTLELASHAPQFKNGQVLEQGDTVIISGGARGVTAEVAIALAKAGKPTLLLLGRSPGPHDEPDWLAGLKDEADIKRGLLEHADGPASPKEIQRECKSILANREITSNIKKAESAGAKVCYRSVDIRDAASVKSAIDEVRSAHGPIRGIVHGAGVLADRLIEDKTIEQFKDVYETKVTGFQNIIDAVPEDDLKFMVMFSSSTARFGRKGQIDYATANEVLNKLAQSEAAKRNNCRVVSLNWGPWAGGMVTPSLAKIFEEEGVGLIGLEAGAEYLVDEITSANDGPVEIVVIAGEIDSALPQTETRGLSPLPTPRSDDPVQSQSARTQDKGLQPLADSPSLNGIAFELELDVENYPFLKSHVINGKAVLPAAVIVEWLAHGALHENPGLRFHGLDKLRILKGVMLDKSESYKIQVVAEKASKNGEFYTAHAELMSGDASITHASADVVLVQTLPKTNTTVEDIDFDPSENGYYADGRLFHGPDFQCLEAIGDCSSENFIAHAKPAPAPSEWSTTPLRNAWLADPLALDCSFQIMILWCLENYGKASLPTKVGEYRQFKREFPKNGTRIVVTVTKHNKRRAVAQLDFVDPESKELVARITGYECTILGTLAEAFKKNTLDEQ